MTGRRRLRQTDGTFLGGLPFVAIGEGPPVVFLCGSLPNHRHPTPGLERYATLAGVSPLARAGFTVYFTNRWPGMPPDITFAEIAERHADALLDHFGEPVDVVGHSTGGSVLLQLIADRPDAVRRAVVASAAYRLGPLAKRAQQLELAELEETGQYQVGSIAYGLAGLVRRRWLRGLMHPLVWLAARRIEVEDAQDAIAMLRAEDSFDVHHRLGDIPTETLVVAGAQDGFWTLDMFAETAYRMPRGRLVLYRRLGHNLTGSAEFVADVSAFLRHP